LTFSSALISKIEGTVEHVISIRIRKNRGRIIAAENMQKKCPKWILSVDLSALRARDGLLDHIVNTAVEQAGGMFGVSSRAVSAPRPLPPIAINGDPPRPTPASRAIRRFSQRDFRSLRLNKRSVWATSSSGPMPPKFSGLSAAFARGQGMSRGRYDPATAGFQRLPHHESGSSLIMPGLKLADMCDDKRHGYGQTMPVERVQAAASSGRRAGIAGND
jgi:hypothetical protein